jgi:hypothetical protein
MRATIDISALPTPFDCLLAFPPSCLGLLRRFEPESRFAVFDVGEELGRDELALLLSVMCFVPKTCLSGCQLDTGSFGLLHSPYIVAGMKRIPS